MAADTGILHAIQHGWESALRAAGEVLEIGPFLVTLDPVNDMVWVSYAVPIQPCSDSQVDSAMPRLREIFAARGRTLRFELIEDLFPAIASRLTGAGLRLQARLPLMACTAADMQDAGDRGVRIEPLAADAPDQALAAYLRLRDSGFGMQPAADLGPEVAQLRAQLATGAMYAVCAFMDGALAGAGARMAGGSVSELVGVVTHPDFRRRGVASAVSRFLTREHLERGGMAAWLGAADDAARAVYAKIGFRTVGWQTCYIAAPAAAP